jgi:hypothetical protein
MRRSNLFTLAIIISACSIAVGTKAALFEGHIKAMMTRGGRTDVLLYTVGTNYLRVENTATNWPYTVDILDRNTGELTLVSPVNRSFVRLMPDTQNPSAGPGFLQTPAPPALPNMPAFQSVGPANLSGVPAPPVMPQVPAMPNMPSGFIPPPAPGSPKMPYLAGVAGGMSGLPTMPQPAMGRMELHDTGLKTNLLGYVCKLYQIRQFGETMMIGATDQLIPFQPYLKNQSHHFGPPGLEERWGYLMKANNLFPLFATLKLDNGSERFHFEVTSIAPHDLSNDESNRFQPPPEYTGIQPLPF